VTAAGQPGPWVLVVDDDPHVRQAIQWALEDEGFAVEAAADGQAALELAASRRPDLVLLDITLPRLDGYAVARALRGEHGPALPILAITADGQAPEKARRVGAYAFVRKPFELDELLAAVRAGLAG
jgi:two-component system response regulator MprA